jgi:hypothetical protein
LLQVVSVSTTTSTHLYGVRTGTLDTTGKVAVAVAVAVAVGVLVDVVPGVLVGVEVAVEVGVDVAVLVGVFVTPDEVPVHGLVTEVTF